MLRPYPLRPFDPKTAPRPSDPPQASYPIEIGRVVRGSMQMTGLVPAVAAARLRGDGPGVPVLVLPGFLATDASSGPMRGFLKASGHHAYGWGLGRNMGDVAGDIVEVAGLVQRIRSRHGAPVHLVGWSLGGLIARAVARRIPGDIAQVMTMGTPLIGGPKYTIAAERYRREGRDLDAIEQRIAQQTRVPLPHALTVFFSQRDRVVAWEACIDHNPENEVDHFRIDCGHLEFGVCPPVLQEVDKRLRGL